MYEYLPKVVSVFELPSLVYERSEGGALALTKGWRHPSYRLPYWSQHSDRGGRLELGKGSAHPEYKLLIGVRRIYSAYAHTLSGVPLT